ncbi:MAG: RHS repeat-associated core domain-containing protein [Firmicutes bacterium]|nr:RHS repeat-associated core domain-containing protein [Bacillota bacterium]
MHIFSQSGERTRPGTRQEKKFDAGTANEYIHKYHTEGSRIHKEHRGYTNYDEYNPEHTKKPPMHTLWYHYDQQGLCAIECNGVMYYVKKNLQGDVVMLLNSDGTVAAKYAYDAWGNHRVYDGFGTLIFNSLVAGSYWGYQNHIGILNPFRYRSYYFDTETGWYYLQTRYYDPQVGRFINADDSDNLLADMLSGCNPYTYCLNDPVNMIDDCGTMPAGIKGLFIFFENGFVAVSELCKQITTKPFKPISHLPKGTDFKSVGAYNSAGKSAHEKTKLLGPVYRRVALGIAFAAVTIEIICSLCDEKQTPADTFDIAAKFGISMGVITLFSLIPIPFVGPALGIAASIGIDYLIDNAGGVTQIITDIGGGIAAGAQTVAKAVNNGWNNVVKGWNKFWSFSWLK